MKYLLKFAVRSCRTYAMSDPRITYQVGLRWSTMSALILGHNHVGPLIGYQVGPTGPIYGRNLTCLIY